MNTDMNIDWDARNYAEHFSFVPKYGRDLFELLIGDKLKILDLGCGGGMLTKELCDRGHDVTGTDLSESQIEYAKKCFPEINFFVSDAVTLNCNQKFDAVFSNAVLHWIDERNQPLVAKNVFNCLKKGGQFVLEMGGIGNNALIHGELERQFAARGLEYRMPFFFPSVGQYASVLEGAGFRVVYALLFDRPTPLEGENGLKEWMDTFVKAPFYGIDAAVADQIKMNAQAALKDRLLHDGVWYADYVRLRMKALKN